MTNISMESLNDTHLPGLISLFENVFGSVVSHRRATWRYLSNGGIARNPGVVAIDEGRIVASYTMWPVEMLIGGEKVLGAQSMDTMTHPDYRGRGLFIKLAQACYKQAAADGFEVVYGFPNDAAYPGRLRRLNWDHTGDIATWKRIITPVAHSKFSRLSRVVWSKVYRTKPIAGLDAKEERLGWNELAQLAKQHEERLERQVCRIARSESWLAWRYSIESDIDYRIVSVREAGNLKAAIVWRMNDTRVLVCEAFGSKETLRAAFEFLALLAYRLHASVIIALSSDPVLISSLKASRFWARGRRRLMVRALASRTLQANIHHHPSWVINGGDFDVF